MMYEKGNEQSLYDIANKFISFLQNNDSNNKAFTLLDNRLNSFYGSTLSININSTDKYYLSMEYQKIDVEKSYQNFIDNYDGYCSEYVDYTKNYGAEMLSKYGIKNIFSDNGEFISFSLHTMYDNDLWMCEQGGVTSERETYSQLNNMNILPIALRYTIKTGTYMSEQTIPYIIYPGLGLPMLTISDYNKEMYDVDMNGINYYFTRDDYNVTISIMIENKGANPPLWQSLCFGMLDCSEYDNYSMPLYIGGGTQGIKQDYHYCKAGYRSGDTYVDASKTFYGNSVSLDMYNPCLSNSNILSITKFNYSDTSNFLILSPSGIWSTVYNYEQNQKKNSIYLDKPIQYSDKSFVLNTSSNNGNNMDMYSITYTSSIGYKNNEIDNKIIPVSVFINDNKEIGFIGSIKGLYSINSKNSYGGEITVDNKKYLCIPCGWDYRQKYYSGVVDMSISNSIGKTVNGVTLTEKDVPNESLVQYYDNIHNILRNNYIEDKLLIELGE